MKKSMWLTGLGVVGALALTSCGSGSSAASTLSESEYVTALSKAIAAEGAFGGDATSADCLATGIVQTIGVKTLNASNLKPEDFTTTADLNLSGAGEGKINAIVDFLLGGKCVDVAKNLATSMRAKAGDSMTDAQATCVAEKVVKQDSFRSGFRASLTGSPAKASQADADGLRAALAECGVKLGA
jgi:hypothetical protein